LLKIDTINVFRDGSHVLEDVSLAVQKGEVVFIVGRNGAGKTTLLRSVLGFLRPVSGRIEFLGKNIVGLPPFEIVRMGVGYAPDDLRIFPRLTVEENIELPTLAGSKLTEMGKDKVESLYSIFPALQKYKKKLGTQISGGERKMLAIARALAADPSLVLLDEPFEGLSPIMRQKFSASLRDLVKSGLTLLITGSNLYHAPEFTDRLYALERGATIYSGALDEAWKNDQVRDIFVIR